MRRFGFLLLGLASAAAAQTAKPAPTPGTMPEQGDDLGTYFQAMDADRDGAISRAEFDRWFGTGAGAGGGQQLADYWTLMDANRDGRVTRDEYLKANGAIDRSDSGD